MNYIPYAILFLFTPWVLSLIFFPNSEVFIIFVLAFTSIPIGLTTLFTKYSKHLLISSLSDFKAIYSKSFSFMSLVTGTNVEVCDVLNKLLYFRIISRTVFSMSTFFSDFHFSHYYRSFCELISFSTAQASSETYLSFFSNFSFDQDVAGDELAFHSQPICHLESSPDKLYFQDSTLSDSIRLEDSCVTTDIQSDYSNGSEYAFDDFYAPLYKVSNGHIFDSSLSVRSGNLFPIVIKSCYSGIYPHLFSTFKAFESDSPRVCLMGSLQTVALFKDYSFSHDEFSLSLLYFSLVILHLKLLELL